MATVATENDFNGPLSKSLSFLDYELLLLNSSAGFNGQTHVIPRPKAVGDLSRKTEMSLERYVVI